MSCISCCSASHMQPCENHMMSCNRPVQRAVMTTAIISGIIQSVVIVLICIWIKNVVWLSVTASVLALCVTACIFILAGLIFNIPNLLLTHTVVQIINGVYALTAVGLNIAALVAPEKFEKFYDASDAGQVRKKATIFLALNALCFLGLNDISMVLKCRRHLIDCRENYEQLIDSET